MSAEGQSSVVSLVQQLKAGSITKEELFLKLSSLQPLTFVQKSKKPAADASPQPTSPSAPRPSRVVAAAPIKADISTNQTTSASAGATKGARFSGQDDVKQSQKSPVFSRGGGPALVDPSSEKYTLMPESLRPAAVASARRPTSAPRSRATLSTTTSARPQTPTKGGASAAPPTPSRTAGQEPPVFYERMIAWVNKRDMDAEEKRKRLEAHATDGCTFKPFINDLSRHIELEKPVVERLYDTRRQKEEELEALRKMKEEEEVKRTCTFKPAINPSDRQPTPTKSRYREPSPRRTQEIRRSIEDGVDRKAFKPATNVIPPNMTNALQYLSEDPFSRLSKPRPLTPAGHATASPNLENLHPAIIASDSNASVGVKPLSINLDDFYKRQQEFLQQKKAKVESMAKENAVVARSASPRISAKSRSLVDQLERGDFLQRMENESSRRKEDKAGVSESECTFTPRINKNAANLRRRSVKELSEGDLERKQALREQLEKKFTAQDEVECTFKPQVNQYSSAVQSRIRITSDPSTYLQRVELEARQAQMQQRIAVEQQVKKELAECTFKPKTFSAPSYHKAMIQSKLKVDSNNARN